MSAPRNAVLVQGNPLKLGIFGANCSSGRSYTTIPERWVASWENNLALGQMADALGIECMIPIARWKGYGGETNVNGTTLESMTWAAGSWPNAVRSMCLPPSTFRCTIPRS